MNIIDFTEWKDKYFSLYKDGTYYPLIKSESPYFNILLIIDFKKQKHYSLNELVGLWQKENHL